jgi:PHO85 cyclin-1
MDKNCTVAKLLSAEPVTQRMIDLMTSIASNVIQVHETANTSTSLPNLPTFIESIIRKSESKASVMFLATVYVDRLRSRLPTSARGLPCTRHRVFLAAVIVAYKYLNDVSIKNKNWARITPLFSLSEINLMERQFLDLLTFDLNFKLSDLVDYLSKVSPVMPAADSLQQKTIDVVDPLQILSSSDTCSNADFMSASSDDNLSTTNDHRRSPSPPPLSMSEASSYSSISEGSII